MRPRGELPARHARVGGEGHAAHGPAIGLSALAEGRSIMTARTHDIDDVPREDRRLTIDTGGPIYEDTGGVSRFAIDSRAPSLPHFPK